MALQPRLDLRQAQTLVMTPQLQQAIKLLQLSNMELTAFVEQELERNPMLERDERPAESFEDRVPAEQRRDAEAGVVVDAGAGGVAETPLDIDIDNSYDEGSPYEGPSYDPDTSLGSWDGAGSGGRSDFGGDERSIDETLSQSVSLRDHLVSQLDLDISAPSDRMVGMALIDSLDDAGWLAADLAEIADGLGTTIAHVEAVLARVQRFDPAGLFARSLKECLALQLVDRNRLDPAMQCMLDHLDLLARRDYAGLMRLCRVDAEDLQDMIAEIRALDPKPAVRFGGGAAEPVVPDVLVRSGPGNDSLDGAWIIELNPDTLPRVLLNNRYYARVSKAASREDKSFITETFQTASWLVKALDQRANTILKVSTEIIRQQNRFLEIGVGGLRPLILRDIAEAVDLHESTVSRVTSNKYISTPRGVFELKYFFTQAINAADGGNAHSAEAVRYRIKALIDAESPSAVLSDDTLVDILRKEGIDIARRTVAKYREGMKIPSSVQRRREKSVKSLLKTR
ncbi:RNA polymerase factor sigma-54 [Novispirillum itersonii]|uniref:RNA polymerase factor sigma-54 n=1 Tax=Novispirillum itersonii TaxID=189 RepID=UPI00039A982E|nr:RNA polymerase factor sigma-54 [Novispirillum itersonii]